MDIIELKDGSKKVEVTGNIVELGDVVDGAGWQRRDATLMDSSGTIKLVLWDEQTQKVSVSDVVQIENGYVKAYQGELQLSTGKWGKLSILESKPLEVQAPAKSLQTAVMLPKLPKDTMIHVSYGEKVPNPNKEYHMIQSHITIDVPVELKADAQLVALDFVQNVLAKRLKELEQQ